MPEKQDIFDKIMSWKCFKFIQPFYKKYKEILLYLLFGGLTFLVSIGSYVFCEQILNMNPLIANIFSWIFAVTFAYITNRIWVFKNVAHGAGGIAKEVISFFAGRAVTLALEELILYLGIDLMGFPSLAVKIAGQVIVVVSNYVISKLLIFRNKK